MSVISTSDIDDPRKFDGNFRDSAAEKLLVKLCAIITACCNFKWVHHRFENKMNPFEKHLELTKHDKISIFSA